MGLAHEKKSYLQEKANLFEIGSTHYPVLVSYAQPERIIPINSGKETLFILEAELPLIPFHDPFTDFPFFRFPL